MKATHALVRACEYEWRKMKLFAHKSAWLPEGKCVWRSEPTEQLRSKACVLSSGPEQTRGPSTVHITPLLKALSTATKKQMLVHGEETPCDFWPRS